MRAGSSCSWIVVLGLLTACGDDSLATPSTSTTQAVTGSSVGSDGEATRADTGAPTTTGGGDPDTTGMGATTLEGTTGDLATSTGDVVTTDAASTTDAVGSSDDTGASDDTSTGEPPLPGCGDTPPADFDAKPSGPMDESVVMGTSTELEVTISGQILADATAKFHLREVHTLTEADDFTIVILPDTQNYTQFAGNFPQFPAQTKWVWDHRNTDRIVAVLHNGDVVQHGNIEEIEWQRAETAMKTIEESTTKFPDGIPYGIAVGNHDNGSSSHDDVPFSTALFNKYFGVARFKDRGYYGGHYGKKNDNSWIVVKAGNLEIVMVNLEYRGALGQDPDILAWAKGIFKEHPHALGIVNSHHIVKANGDFGAQGKQIYEVMKTVDNVQLMTSGHIKEIRARRTDNHNGHKIHSMLADYQDLIIPAEKCAGGCGYMRIWRFSPMKNQLKVETYSPWLKKSMTGDKEQFTLTVDMSAATGVFSLAGTTKGPGATLALPVDGLKAGGKYEWYSVVTMCGAKVTTGKRQFTVQ